MKSCRCSITTLVVLALFYLIFPEKAYAYIDLGTGSYILQLIIAALMGGFFSVKVLRNKIKIFFRSLFSRGKKDEKAED